MAQSFFGENTGQNLAKFKIMEVGIWCLESHIRVPEMRFLRRYVRLRLWTRCFQQHHRLWLRSVPTARVLSPTVPPSGHRCRAGEPKDSTDRGKILWQAPSQNEMTSCCFGFSSDDRRGHIRIITLEERMRTLQLCCLIRYEHAGRTE